MHRGERAPNHARKQTVLGVRSSQKSFTAAHTAAERRRQIRREIQPNFVYTELSKKETRRMKLLATPMVIVVVICSMTMGALWSVLFALVALIPYSFFYTKAYAVVAARRSSPPALRFYTGVVLVQLVFIAILVARARA